MQAYNLHQAETYNFRRRSRKKLGKVVWPVIRNFFMASAVMAAALGLANRASAQNVSYAETVSAGVPLKVICVNLNDPNVKITGILTKYGAGHAEAFGTLIGRTKPTVAITGTFFGISNKIPVGDIVIDGRLAHF